jgi:tripartite-type tricarboxylate transporter receptor subunit TctC
MLAAGRGASSGIGASCGRMPQEEVEYMTRILAAALCAASLAFAAAPALAQGYPSGPITLVVPLAPGDATDTAARVMADALSKQLNVPIVVVNKPGAGGALGAQYVVQAAKDGSTITLTNNASLIYRSILQPQIASYNALTDLTPLALGMRSPSILAVGGEQPFKTFGEMVEYAKKNPGKVRIGTAGEGSVGDFCVRMLNSLTGAGIVMVPYKGASPAVTAMRGGQIEGVVLALGTMVPLIKQGAVRGLVVSTKWPDLPGLPTLEELGYPQPLFGIWTGFFAPAGVPQDVTRALVPALARVVQSPEVAGRLKPLGIAADYSPPDKLVAEIRDEHARVLAIAQKEGLAKGPGR